MKALLEIIIENIKLLASKKNPTRADMMNIATLAEVYLQLKQNIIFSE